MNSDRRKSTWTMCASGSRGRRSRLRRPCSLAADVVARTAALATAGYPNVAAALAVDVACGPATFARAFAPIVGRVVGVDFTPAMLAKARRVVGEAGLANVEFVRGDGNALPFADGTFDLAQCTYAFHHFPEPAKVLGEMARVVRKGGRVTVVDAIIPERADAELERSNRAAAGCVAREDADRYRPAGTVSSRGNARDRIGSARARTGV